MLFIEYAVDIFLHHQCVIVPSQTGPPWIKRSHASRTQCYNVIQKGLDGKPANRFRWAALRRVLRNSGSLPHSVNKPRRPVARFRSAAPSSEARSFVREVRTCTAGCE
jgi:hypothetical protein